MTKRRQDNNERMMDMEDALQGRGIEGEKSEEERGSLERPWQIDPKVSYLMKGFYFMSRSFCSKHFFRKSFRKTS